jgi:hypothetical protein
MKLFSANVEDLRSLYITQLQKALDMEQKITKALPDLIEATSDPDLRAAFSNHLEQTRGHVLKVQQLVRTNTGETSTETCKVINGLTTEASDTIKDVTDPSIRDIALIGAAQQPSMARSGAGPRSSTFRTPTSSAPSKTRRSRQTRCSPASPSASICRPRLRHSSSTQHQPSPGRLRSMRTQPACFCLS